MKVEALELIRGGRRVLGGITAAAAPGELTMVLGANGSGKTTLLRAMAGLQTLDRGRVLLAERTVHDRSPRERAREIGYVPQRFRGDVPFSVVHLLHMATPSRRRIDEVMSAFDLDGLRHRPFGSLSVGQQQRVVIARAMVQVRDPAVLILDEPLAALDFRHAAVVLEHLKQRARRGSTIILSVHDLGLASAHADHAWLLAAGELVSAGHPAEVLGDDRLREVFGMSFDRLPDPHGRTWLVPRDAVEGLH